MKFLKITAFVLMAISVFAAFFLWNSGAFSTIIIKQETRGPYYVVGIERYGNYGESNIYIDNVYRTLLDIDVKTNKNFGIYWDNPKKVPEENCHSLVGCIVDTKDTIHNRRFARQGLVFQKIGITNYITAEYPYNNFISKISGIIRVYPQFEDYLKKHKLKGSPSMEIYDPINKKMVFMMQINRK